MSLRLPSRVDPKLWQKCAGPDVKIPKIHSKVYYFPQGHLEHACSSPTAATINFLGGYRPSFPCIVLAVDFLVEPLTDEVFAKLVLNPVSTDGGAQEPGPLVVPGQEDGNNLASYVKTLTITDTQSGFNIPRECTDLFFPKLELDNSKEVSVTDLPGNVYTYTHTKQSRLTKGWNNFVSEKKLLPGDSVVFIKNSSGKIHIGIRRNPNFPAAEGGERGRKLTESAVLDAVDLANKNVAFEVVFYPTAGNWCNFVVDAKVVDDAMKFGWKSGMRAKLHLKEPESSNLTIRGFQREGTISNDSSNVPNWRMLEVKWYEPNTPQKPPLINPWEVEVYPSTSSSTANISTTKSPKLSQSSSPRQIQNSLMPTTLTSLPPPPYIFPSDMQGVGQEGADLFAGSSGTLLDTGLKFGSSKDADLFAESSGTLPDTRLKLGSSKGADLGAESTDTLADTELKLGSSKGADLGAESTDTLADTELKLGSSKGADLGAESSDTLADTELKLGSSKGADLGAESSDTLADTELKLGSSKGAELLPHRSNEASTK